MMQQYVQTRIDFLTKTIAMYDDSYYNKQVSIVSNDIYDQLYKELVQLESEYPHLTHTDSPTKKVAGSVQSGFKVLKHIVPMLSIRTIAKTTLTEIFNWFTYIKDLGCSNYDVIIEHKYDGLSCSLHYKYGKLVAALTRGDGDEGEDVLMNIVRAKCVPLFIQKWSNIAKLQVRGEVLIYKEDFQDFKDVYSNPRNAASGALRTFNKVSPLADRLRFLAYSIHVIESNARLLPDDKTDSQSNILDLLEEVKFQVGSRYNFNTQCQEGISLKIYEKFKEYENEIRNILPYEIDGLVIKLNQFKDQKEVGFNNREPKWSAAIKFKPEEQVTKLLAIDVQVGRTGAITPVARLNPVSVGGVVVSNITLHNVFDLRNRKVKVGDSVIVRRAGDVIPEISGYVKEMRPFYLYNFQMPKVCPVCSGKVGREKGERKYYCLNNLGCSAQLKNAIEHFASKRAMAIEGLGPAIISDLVDKGFVANILDIYRLNAEALEKYPEFSGKKMQNVLQAIQDSKDITFQKFIFACGIKDVGEGTAKNLAKHYNSVQEIEQQTVETLSSIKDIGHKTATSIFNYLKDKKNYLMLLDIERNYLRIKTLQTETKLKDLTFVVTGTLPTLARSDVEKLVIANGGNIGSSVSSKTNYLVAGENAGSKLSKAKELNVTILDENQFKELIGT